MTSDAKIGLLLGLVFIFVIAFLINGLPGLHNKDDTNKLTKNMVGLKSSPAGLGANERKVQMTLEQPTASPVSYEAQAEPVAGSTDTRFTMELPQASPSVVDSTPASQTIPDAVAAQPSADNTAAVVKSDASKPAPPQFYVVQESDTLSSITKKCYGEQEGNKLANVNAIFEANRITLISADELQVGQKLVIPPLAAAAAPASTPGSTLSEKVFSKIDSIGKRHLPAVLVKPSTSASAAKSSTPAKQGNIYIVKEGDSLWRIASEQLGDGNRYKEIVKLNNDILASEDDIQVDMKLKLPAR
ncbi:MAG: LysM peptidoglycan-binding domain-containing protein [Planctomycetota bacterium]